MSNTDIGEFLCLFVCYFDFTLCPGGIHDNFADRRNCDFSFERVLDADDGGRDGCVDLTFLKGKVSFLHFAVYKSQLLAVTQGLCADDGAVFEGDIFAVPCKIFALDGAILYIYILCVPEGVLRIKAAVFKAGVFNVLKRILALHAEIFEQELLCSQKHVFALGTAIIDVNSVDRPSEFGRDDVAVFKSDVAAFAKSFYAVHF